MHNPETGVNEETDEANSTVRIVGGNVFVELDPDHPGFQDEGYRERRNEIAKIAIEWNEMSMAERWYKQYWRLRIVTFIIDDNRDAKPWTTTEV